jgi:glycosyltransferase involved in cell wall biosynthesis
MKIEMVVPALPAAGMEMVVARLTEGLSRRGHDVGVTCILAKGPVADTLERAGHRVTLVPALGLRTNLLPLRLYRWLARLQPDVVHVHSGAWLKTARAAALAHVPRLLYTMHGHDRAFSWYEPLLDRWAARYTSVTVAVSEALIPYLTGKVGIPTRRLRVITNGIDVERFSPGPRTGRVRQQFGLGDDDIVIGVVARFTPVKNHTMLLDAIQAVLKEQPRAFLAIVGDGPLRADIAAHVDSLGIRQRVGFLGQISDLPTLYRDLDLLALSSLSEATSISILEGMATGVPVVATAVGGTPELLAHGETGALVQLGDVRSFASALVRLANTPAERTRLGRAGRKRALMLYSDGQMIDAYENLYSSGADGP